MSDHILQAASPEVDISESMSNNEDDNITEGSQFATSQSTMLTSAKQAFSQLRNISTLASSVNAVNGQRDAPSDSLGSRNLLRILLKKFNCNFGEGAHRRRRQFADGEPLNEVIISSALSDRLDWDRWNAAKRALACLRHRTAAGHERFKATQMAYRVRHKELIKQSTGERDGPNFDTKQCSTCSKFVPRRAQVCPQCGISLTLLGASTLGYLPSSPENVAHTASSAATLAQLAEVQLSIEPKRKFVVSRIHDHRGRKQSKEYQVEWAGYPAVGEWTWESLGVVERTEAFTRFHSK
jgi:hypothetical protein